MEHEIKTISDILKVVNHDNLENFLKDFELFLTNYVILKAMCENDATCNEFTWIDDGKHNIKVNIKAKDYCYKCNKPTKTTGNSTIELNGICCCS